MTVDHGGVPLGRYPGTLELEDRADGLHWAVDPPESRADIREAVERGDLRAGSWRMVVGRDEWRGDVRHVHEIAELQDVAVATRPAYRDAVVEYRSTDPAEGQEDTMSEHAQPAARAGHSTAVEDRTETQSRRRASAGRGPRQPAGEPARGLADEFRSARVPRRDRHDRLADVRGPGRRRGRGPSTTSTRPRSNAGALGYDQRYAWPAFPRVACRRRRHLRRRADPDRPVARDRRERGPRDRRRHRQAGDRLDADDRRPPLNQVATIQSNVPNVYLEQQAFNTVIENDLRLAINDGLDKLVLDKFAAVGFQAPGTDPLLVSVRKAMTTILAAGYNPDTLILTPAAAEALDAGRVGHRGRHARTSCSPRRSFAPDQIFGLNKRISKTIPAPAVVDSTALGKLYASPVSAWPASRPTAGTTNRSNVRMELHGVFGVERQTAAVRIAAS